MIRILVILFVMLACPAMSQPVKVSAGEHGSFTRIILDFESRPKWDARRNGRGYRIAFDNTAPLSFDLSRVFRLIDRQRVSDIRASGNNRLDLDLACDCDIRLGEAGETALIVDVVSLSETEPRIQSQVGSPSPPTGNFAMPELPTQDAPGTDRSTPASMPHPSADTAPSSTLVTGRALGGLPVLDFKGSDQSVALEMMGRALSRAAAQGLVTANTDLQPRTGETAGGHQGLPSARGNVSVTTSFDRAMRPDAAPAAPTHAGAVCTPTSQIDVLNWGDVGDRDMLGRLRSRAVAENGSVDPRKVGDLARYYVYLGFGREARVAAGHMPDSMDRQIVEALADIMDSGRSAAVFLKGQAACESASALWATLAEPLTEMTTPASLDSILSTFSALPPHLRNHLGPLLSDRLHAAGLEEGARVAMNAVTRSGKKTEESELASAKLELDGTHGDMARETLSALSNGTNLTAAGALLELLRDAEKRGMPPNPNWVEDAPSMIGALDGTEIAEELNIAALRGLIALGRFEDFRQAVLDDTPGLTPARRLELAKLGLETALEAESDQDFLLAEIGLSRIVSPESFSRETRISMSARLLDVGLAGRAMNYLPASPETPEELAVAVRGLIATGQTGQAIELALQAGYVGTEAVLASAYVANGRDREAIEVFAGFGETTGALAAALRSGDWESVSQIGPEPIAQASRVLSGSVAEVATENSPNGALIQATRDRRAQVEALLELTRPQAAMAAFTN